MARVNNVTRMLDARRISYTAHDLPVEKLGARDAAELLGVPAAIVFKTIVVRAEKARLPYLVVVPGDATVDLKLVASFLGEKRVHLPSEHEAEQLTGLQAGGISPLALINKGFKVLIDASAEELGEIFVSGGQRGLNLQLRSKDLAALTNARFAPVATRSPRAGTGATLTP